VKFLCDRCKTRYSIGEDRVRGKILKIRCKNCANVITVREGMTDDGGIDPPAERRSRPTTGGQAADRAPASSALGAAFQSQLTKPPPALEEEWYVSIDGVQTGPLSLPDAQKWVASKPFDADLHCWSEGFDDWLPVDKVSHFRGLRKPPPARPTGKTVPPPIPRREDEPKPLFASTMASLEKSAGTSMPALAPAPTLKGPGVGAVRAKANGMGGASPMTGKGTAPMPSMPVPSIPAMPNRGSASQGAKAPKSAGAAALAQAFDTENVADAKTSIGAPAFRDPPFKDEVPTTADPFAARRAERDDPFFPKAKTPEPMQPTSRPDPNAFGTAPRPGVPIFNDEDDGLEIGEVSRVVKLADLVPKPQKAATASFEKLSATGSVARVGGIPGPMQRIGGLTASSPKLSPSELGMNVDPSLATLSPTGEPASDESVVAKSFKQRHRRSLFALIGIAVAMVVGVVALFVFVVNNDSDDVGGPGLGGIRSIDTSRPEDIVRKQLPPPPNATGSGGNATKRWTGRTGNGNNITAQNPQPDEIANGKTLQASEVEDMAAKQGEGTKRCYMRAQKGALGFEIADVKKIAVTLMVNKDGTVGDVQLSDHAKDTFGQCLIARIKGWKFRESNGGTFRISLAFSNS